MSTTFFASFTTQENDFEPLLEKYEIDATEKEKIQDTILEAINRLGKSSHALLKYKDRFWVADHTARKGASKEYYKHEVKYHPYASQLD